MEKKCNKCKLLLNFNEFYNKKTGKNKLSGECKKCIRERTSIWQKKNRCKINNQTKIRNNSRSENGICLVCNDKVIDCNYSLCEKHFLKYVSYRHLGTKTEWLFLKELLKKQNYKCKYSGIDLILGKNASIDHIKSRSKYPELKKY